MVYAVSDTSGGGRRRQAADAKPARRATPRRVALHWPRVIALAANTLAWVAIITVARRLFHR